MAVKVSASITLTAVVDVEATTRWYLLRSSTLAAPSKPTSRPPGGLWSVSEPGYTEGSTNSLYFTDLTLFSDGTWSYSEVSLSSSYEAAKQAYNKAQAVEDQAGALDARLSQAELKIEDDAIIATVTSSERYMEDLDNLTLATDAALGLAERVEGRAGEAAALAQEALEGSAAANQAIRTLQTSVTQTENGLSVVISRTTDVEGRVQSLESGVHIGENGIGIYKEGSPFRNTVTNDGWMISENDSPIITCAETKLTAPRVQITDALIIGNSAWKAGSDNHLRLLKYGR